MITEKLVNFNLKQTQGGQANLPQNCGKLEISFFWPRGHGLTSLKIEIMTSDSRNVAYHHGNDGSLRDNDGE